MPRVRDAAMCRDLGSVHRHAVLCPLAHGRGAIDAAGGDRLAAFSKVNFVLKPAPLARRVRPRMARDKCQRRAKRWSGSPGICAIARTGRRRSAEQCVDRETAAGHLNSKFSNGILRAFQLAEQPGRFGYWKSNTTS